MIANIHRWILTHDESKIFIVLYIGLAVLLAIFLGLFWLAMVVFIHLVMEIIKQHNFDRRFLPVLTRSIWELKLDVGLVICGLVIGLYIDVIFGLVGLSHLARAGAQTAARASMWPRIIRGALLTLDDVALVAKGVSFKKKEEQKTGNDAGEDNNDAGEDNKDQEESGNGEKNKNFEDIDASDKNGSDDNSADEGNNEIKPVGMELWGPWIAPKWSWGDRISLSFTVINILLIIAAPLLTDYSLYEVWQEILSDLHPFSSH